MCVCGGVGGVRASASRRRHRQRAEHRDAQAAQHRAHLRGGGGEWGEAARGWASRARSGDFSGGGARPREMEDSWGAQDLVLVLAALISRAKSVEFACRLSSHDSNVEL